MKTSIALFFFINFSISYAQIGGTVGFSLLDIDYSARAAGVGGDLITIKDNDLNLAVNNPSLLNAEMHNRLGINQTLFPGRINQGQVAYARSLKNGDFLSGHIRYVNYGKMDMTDFAGVNLGTFNPFEYVAGVGYARQLNPRISVGANLNAIGSHIESYSAFGATIDLGATFTPANENLIVTSLFRNVGYQFKSYVKESRADMPADFQLGVSYKLEHAPIRFSLVAHHLNKWDLSYTDPNLKETIDPVSGDTIPVKYAGFGEKLAQHFTYQVEFYVGEHVVLRSGFNYYRRQELKLESRPGISGLSFGAGFNFKRFSLDYAFSYYSRAGMQNSLCLTGNLDKIKK